MDSLVVNLFGSPKIICSGSVVRGFVSTKAAALAYYLAASGRTHAREALAGLLWPDVPDAQALKNVRDVLSNLRRLLGSFITITRQTVVIHPELVVLDTRHFAALLGRAQDAPSPADGDAALREAVTLYTADFLEGFMVADAPLFDEWLVVERERLRGLLLHALESLAARAVATGAYYAGIADAARLLALDPLREPAHRLMMQLLAASGQRAAALAQYETCRHVLDEELGLDPDDATQALHKQLLDGTLGGLVPPATTPATRPIYHVPALLTTLVGRAAELTQATAWLLGAECRLLSIVGMGGVGKTSLALGIAHQLHATSRRGERFGHGIAFVDLSAIELADASQFSVAPLVAAVADTLDLIFAGPEAAHVQLANYLREKDLLLLLDNCEHLVHAADFVVSLLHAAPKLAIIATSRVRLHVRGEQIIALGGLAVPAPRATNRPARGEQPSALQLFRRVAQSVAPQQPWDPDDDAAAVTICTMLDGLPLGIELAASLTRLMPCAEIARGLGGSLALLDSTRRDLPQRHRSLHAVFDHSWRLLSQAEQRVLCRLSVFRGGWSREAAQEIADASVGLLAALLDQSLVRRVANDTHQAGRYDLLDLVHHYAAEHLASPPMAGEQHALAERHARYYLQYLVARTPDLRAHAQQVALAEIHREIENIRVAWRWAVAQKHLGWLRQAAEGIFSVYEFRSRFQDGSDLFAHAVQQLDAMEGAPDHAQVLGKLLACQGWLAFQAGHQDQGRALLVRAVALLQTTDAATEVTFALSYLAAATYHTGDYHAAEAMAAQALLASAASADQQGMAVAHMILGQIAYMLGRYADAQLHARDSLAIDQALGNRWGTVFALVSLGQVALALGDYPAAQRAFQEGFHIRQAMHDTRGVALCLSYLGDTAAATGAYAEARRCYRESLALFQEIGNGAALASALVKLGNNALASAEPDAAHAHFLAALRAAWESHALPHVLAALAGLAVGLARTDASQAHALATIVVSHPATARAARAQAAEVLGALATPQAAPAVAQLEPMVLSLLDHAS